MNLVIELNINNLSDWAIIKPLLERLKIKFVQKNEQKQAPALPETENTALLNDLYSMLDAGVDASYYGDAVAYQREVREDVLQPTRP
jgi:hypothetical protein